MSSAKARADTQAGLERPAAAHLVFANFETRGIVDDPAAITVQLGVTLGYERGRDASANGACRRLPIA